VNSSTEEPPDQGGSSASRPAEAAATTVNKGTTERTETTVRAPRRAKKDMAGVDTRPPTNLTRVCLHIAYDGGAFKGFAENAGVETVAGVLRAKLEKVYSQPIVLTCAGRTDAGVHARGQVVTFGVRDAPVEPLRLRKSLNSLLAPRVVVSEVSVVDPRFDARYAALWRSYRYYVLNSEIPDPFVADTAWWVDEPLDITAMQEAARPLLGLHDFTSFCRRPKATPEATLVRRLLHAEWVEEEASGASPRLLRFEIAASAFCHQMVRSIVGAVVDVGRGRSSPEHVQEILAAQDRSIMNNIAPPHGLILWQVGYPGEPTPDWNGAVAP